MVVCLVLEDSSTLLILKGRIQQSCLSLFINIMVQHSLRFELQARYCTLGEPGNTAWLVCHGYGQLAGYFIKNFQPLADLGHYIVAPEGLSRFYLQNHSGRVGASWMTKEDRLTDIQNYLAYLDAVATDAGLASVPSLNLLGFSQGVATISRWATHTSLPIQKLVLWAGVYPPDVSPEMSSSRLQNTTLYQVWGTRDPFLQNDEVEKQTSYLKSLQPAQFHRLTFDGEHSLHTPTLFKIATGVNL